MSFVTVTNEGEGVSICMGAWLAGKMPVIIMETSGVLLSVYSLVRHNFTFGVPVLIICTYRGSLGEEHWYAVHTGAALEPVLSALQIPRVVLNDLADVASTLREARRSMDVALKPVCVVLGGRLTREDAH